MRTRNQLSQECCDVLYDQYCAEVETNFHHPHQQTLGLSNEFHSLILLLSLGTSAGGALSR